MIKAHMEWADNKLTGGEDCPHYGTEQANHYAVLVLTDMDTGESWFLRSPDSMYSKKTANAISKAVNEINGQHKQCIMCGCAPCDCED